MSEYVELGDVVRFGITTHNPSGGALINTDETPRWSTYINANDTPTQEGAFTQRTGLTGTYRGTITASVGNGYAAGDFVEIHASGRVTGIIGRAVIKSFVIDDLYKTNIISVSGTRVHYNDIVAPAVYFAGIKFVKDSTVPRDEYIVQWFKNSIPLASGQVTNPALSIYRTSDNTSLFTNAVLNHFSVSHGGLRYNEPTNLAVSGEPYMAIASGTIDGSTRVWNNPIGLDYL